MFDHKNLPPIEQWEPDYEDGEIGDILMMCQHGNINTVNRLGETYCHNTLHFIADARKAIDIQTKLGWYAKMNRYDSWEVYNRQNEWVIDYQEMLDANWQNPFAAIVAAYEIATETAVAG